MKSRMTKYTCRRCEREFDTMRTTKPKEYCHACAKQNASEQSIKAGKKFREKQKVAKGKWVSKTNCQHCGSKPIQGRYHSAECEAMSKAYQKHMDANGGFWN